jgi:ribokinase
MSAAEAVLCQLEVPTHCVDRALRDGRAMGAVTILNPAPFTPVPTDTLALADWIVPNEVEFEGLRQLVLGGRAGELPDDVAALAAALDTSLAVTCGARGALLCTPDDAPRSVAAPSVDVLDSTGAGDAFTGSFAFAIARGVEPEAAGRFACACASSSVQRHGTQSSYPREPELKKLKSMLGPAPLARVDRTTLS